MGKDRFRQTRRMILARGLLAPLITLMLVCATLVYYFADYSRDQVETELVRIASNHRRMIDQFLGERVSDLQFAISSYRVEELSEQSHLKELFRNLQAGSRAFSDLGVFDETGNHLAYVGPYHLAGKNYAEAEWFKAVREKGLYISDVFLGYRNVPHFIIAVRRNEERRSWYLRATIDTLNFNDLVENIRVGKTGEAYLVNRKGIFQTERRSSGKLMQPDPDYGSYQIDDEETTSFSAGKYFSERHLYASGPLKHTDWVLVVRQKASDAYGPLAHAVLLALAAVVVGSTVVVIMAYVLASGLANRLTLANMEKQRIKTQLIMAGKLAEVGEMSAGLAHEINNPLQVMQSELTMIEDAMADMEDGRGPSSPKSLDVIKDSVGQLRLQINRCGHITKGLLKFARKTEHSMQPLKMQDFLPEAVGLVKHRARVESIRITQEIESDLPPITSDSNQLQQVFLNLLNNAMHALRDKDSGEIRIRAFQEDRTIVTSVEDNGCGISLENMERLFVPFFTTKPAGQGTGLGLSTAYGIVKGLGGEITVTSEVGFGTVFTVRLPLESSEEQEAIG